MALTSNATPNTYFASEPIDKIAGAIVDRFARYIDALESNGRLAIWRKSHRCYYGKDAAGGYTRSSAVTYGGQQGETVQLRVNHYRSLLRRLHVMTVEQRPAFDVSTSNDTPEAMAQQVFAQQLIDGAAAAKRDEQFNKALAPLILNQAVALSLANDRPGLRMLAKAQGKQMAKGPYATAFETLTSPTSSLADSITAAMKSVDQLGAFVDDYRERLKKESLSATETAPDAAPPAEVAPAP